jgi:regulator of PEP synthase PpsR (kinase-PPPase family)
MDAVSGTKSSMATSVQCQQQQAFFKDDTRHALRLFFQQQHDLRARRRLLKGYSSADLQKYGLRSEQQQYGQTSTALNSNRRLVLSHAESSSDFLDQKQEAVEYTMRTDDGMAPHLLYKADVILLGVSRAGKTPLSIYMAQTLGLKVANIPLVLELPPPSQLTDRGRVDPRRVFCLTLQSEFLERFRKNRFSSTGGRAIDIGGSSSSKRNECSIQDNVTTTDINSRGSTTSIGGFRGLYSKDKKFSYSQSDYVERDLEHARSLAREYGYTELDGTSSIEMSFIIHSSFLIHSL